MGYFFKHRFLLAIFIFHCFCLDHSFGKPIIVDNQFVSKKVGKYISLFEDSTQQLSIEQIIQNPDLLFQDQQYDQIMIGQRKFSNAWVRLVIRNSRDQSVDLVFHTNDIFTRYMWAYLVQGNNLIKEYHVGVRGHFAERVLKHRSSAIPLTLLPGTEVSLYLKIENKWDPIQFPVQLSLESYFHESTQKEYFLLGLFHGFLIIMVLFAIALYIAMRNRIFLIYFFYVLSALLFSVATSGLDYQFFIPNNPYFAYRGNMLFGAFNLISLFLLVSEFYKTEKQVMRLIKKGIGIVLLLLTLVVFILLIQELFSWYDLSKNLGLLLLPGITISAVCIFLLLILIWITIKDPSWVNIIFLTGYFGIALYGILAILAQNAWIVLPFDKFNLYRFAIILELFCISILMVNRILELQKEKRNLDEQARLEKAKAEKILELDAFKSELYTNITHEFRTPLTLINNMVYRIDGYPTEKETILYSSNRLTHQVDQLLDLAKLQDNQLHLQMIQDDIIQHLDYLAGHISEWCASKEIQFLTNFEDSTCLMDFDPERLQEILFNLCSNAIKHTPAGGQISLEVEVEVEQLLLKFSDSGEGIHPDEITSVFNRFFQGKNTLHHIQKGTGIGLAHTKMLVELMGGKIHVSSQLGVGTIFQFNLPITLNAPLRGSNKPETTKFLWKSSPNALLNLNSGVLEGSAETKILLIEDNDLLRASIQSILSPFYSLETAKNGKLGLEMAQTLLPDLIISDIRMPELNGLDLLNTLKNNLKTSHIPIILLTAKSGEQAKLEGLKLGAAEYLTKPFNPEELIIRIQNILKSRMQLWKLFSTQGGKIYQKSHPLDSALLEKAQAFILDHLDDSTFGVTDLSRLLLMSRPTLWRKINQLTGRSIAGYIRLVRLQEGQRLLLETQDSISQIALSVGFKNVSYFSTAFSQEFGLSPKRTRDGS